MANKLPNTLPLTTAQYNAAMLILKALMPLHPNVTDMVPLWAVNAHWADSFENLMSQCWEFKHQRDPECDDPEELYEWLKTELSNPLLNL